MKQTDILERSGNTGLVDINRHALPVMSCPSKQDTSGIRLVNTCQQVEYRRFSGTVRSDQTVELTFFNVDVKIRLQHVKSSEGDAQILLPLTCLPFYAASFAVFLWMQTLR